MTKAVEIPAKEFSQQLLDGTTLALKARDFDTFTSGFGLPYTMTTSEKTTVITTREQMKTTFDAICRKYEAMGVTDMVRVIEEASYRSPTQIAATHVSHLFSGAQWVTEPYPVFSILELRDEGWQVVYSDYSLLSRGSLGSALHQTGSNN